jgi:hypothetical protein
MENQDKDEKRCCANSTKTKKCSLFMMFIIAAVVILIGIYALNRCKGGTKSGSSIKIDNSEHNHVHEEAEQENI